MIGLDAVDGVEELGILRGVLATEPKSKATRENYRTFPDAMVMMGAVCDSESSLGGKRVCARELG